MPKPELLETFDNPYADRDYEIHMDCSEFTSLCPLGGIETDASELELLKGGAPDFGTMRITYVPAAKCIELKSLKLYINSFRDIKVFHEHVINIILEDFVNACDPLRVEIEGDFNVRGNIKTTVRASYKNKEQPAVVGSR